MGYSCQMGVPVKEFSSFRRFVRQAETVVSVATRIKIAGVILRRKFLSGPVKPSEEDRVIRKGRKGDAKTGFSFYVPSNRQDFSISPDPLIEPCLERRRCEGIQKELFFFLRPNSPLPLFIHLSIYLSMYMYIYVYI